MNPENARSYIRVKKSILFVVLLLVLAGALGLWVGHRKDNNNQQVKNTNQPTNTTPQQTKGISSLATYSLPDGWKEVSCPDSAGSVYINPNGSDAANCSANPIALVKISIDAANSTDCNQLQNVQNVSKHICISEYINGHKSLRAETVYNKDSSYKKTTTVIAYYVSIGDKVVKAEYTFNDDNNYQTGFEQLAKTINAR